MDRGDEHYCQHEYHITIILNTIGEALLSNSSLESDINQDFDSDLNMDLGDEHYLIMDLKQI